MPDRDVVARKIASATAHLQDIDELLGRPREEFLDDTRGRDLSTFQRSTGGIVEWLSDFWCGRPRGMPLGFYDARLRY
jgi:hypothetical protein